VLAEAINPVFKRSLRLIVFLLSIDKPFKESRQLFAAFNMIYFKAWLQLNASLKNVIERTAGHHLDPLFFQVVNIAKLSDCDELISCFFL
jgi:hypothetical protein